MLIWLLAMRWENMKIALGRYDQGPSSQLNSADFKMKVKQHNYTVSEKDLRHFEMHLGENVEGFSSMDFACYFYLSNFVLGAKCLPNEHHLH